MEGKQVRRNPPTGPYEIAWRREFRRRWLARAWADTRRFERRYGLWIGFVVAALAAVVGSLIEGSIQVAAVVLSALAGVLGVLFVTFWVALFSRVGRVAYERVHEAEGDEDPDATWARYTIEAAKNGVGPPTVTFDTERGQQDLRVMYVLRALRFTSPREEIVRKEDLPVVVKLGWRTRLTVKQFTEFGCVIDSNRTGIRVHAELYSGAGIPH